ncbi:hypothetical protein [Curtobacterium sp. L1-20]|uniref:hypothetical protein n=1 Tax=Curtobacterium sp. L1-20 TaxID=3138181 RepID=UPI003B515F47
MPGHPNLLEALRPSRRRMLGLSTAGAVAALTAVVTSDGRADAVDATVMTVNPRTSTAAINAWLAVGGVRVLRGAAVLSGPLVIRSGTQLDASAASITGAVGDNVLRNAAANPSARTTAAVRAGSPVVTTRAAVFSTAMVGRRVQVLGAGPRAGNAAAPGSMYGRIVSVQSSTRVTLDVAATTTLAAAATSVFPPNDGDISITGGTWTNRSKNSVSQTTESHGLLLRRAARVSLTGLTVHSTGSAQVGGQYAVSFGDVTDVTVEDVAFIDTASDGVHFQGPSARIAVRRITGERTGDDLVAFTTVDGQTHAGSQLGDCEGDITDVVVEDVQGKNCLCLLKVTSGIGTNGVQRRIRRFTATGLAGTVTGRSPVQIVDYAGPTWFEGTVSGVTATGTSGTVVNVAVRTLGALVVEDVALPAGARPAVDGIVRVAATSASSVTVRRVTNRSTGSGAASGVALAVGSVPTVAVSGVSCPVLAPQFDSVKLVRASATIRSLTVTDDSSAARGGNVFALAAGGYRITSATFARLTRSTGSVWAADADSATGTAISVSSFRNGRALALLRSPATITVQGLVQPAGSGAALRLNSAAASPVRVVVDGTSSRPAPLVSRTAKQKVSAVSPFIGVDATLLTPRDGDVVLNTGTKPARGQLRWDAKAKRWRTTSVARPKPTPTPTPAPAPSPSPTSAPTTTPAPTPTSSPAPSSSASPAPSASPTPSAPPTAPAAPVTPEPTASASLTPTPSDVPTASPSPTPAS